ncbi:MAG TPA: ParA family protein [Synechococcales cyanobacterium M55_K2018_004]|nr:ParA family protein [Synechococcales cyanobacterium M55_K2018_004]
MITAIANQKGGVAKTTSTIALAGLLAEEGTCLAVDLDPQGNLTMGLGIELEEGQLTTYDVMTGRATASEAIIETLYDIDLLAGDITLAKIEKELQDHPDRFYALRKSLDEVAEDYEQILIDCPPSLGMLTINAFAAADTLLIPVQCQFFALKGLEGLLETIESVKSRINPDLQVLGVLPTMAEPNTVITQDIMKILRSQLDGIRVFNPVPKSVKFPASNMAGEPIHRHTREYRVVQPYREVAREMQILAE